MDNQVFWAALPGGLTVSGDGFWIPIGVLIAVAVVLRCGRQRPTLSDPVLFWGSAGVLSKQ
jgi:hypothetical protein